MRALTAAISSAWLALALATGESAVYAAAAADAAPAASAQDPAQLVQSSAEGLLKDLDANRPLYRKDPKALRGLVDKNLLPHFDIAYSARLVLGQHNRDVSADQRQRFITAFENSLLQNYGSALVEFTANRLKVLPSHVDPSEKSTTVRTQIRRDAGDTVEVDYILHMTPEGWKAWDVVIEGISYVKSFRDDIGSQIDQQGIEAVIQRLERGEKPAAINSQSNGKKS
jgi:phospholipid transport system substrate-binding protein